MKKLIKIALRTTAAVSFEALVGVEKFGRELQRPLNRVIVRMAQKAAAIGVGIEPPVAAFSDAILELADQAVDNAVIELRKLVHGETTLKETKESLTEIYDAYNVATFQHGFDYAVECSHVMEQSRAATIN